MVFGHKAKIQVDLTDFDEEKDSLCGFLHTKLSVNISRIQNKLLPESENLSPEEIQRLVNKYIYHHSLNIKYYVSLEGSTIKVHKFKSETGKPEKSNRHPRSPTMAHGW
jgi:hypothetical protein